MRRSCSDSLLTASQSDGVFGSDNDFDRSRGLRVLSRVTRWPSGWNVERQKHDYEDQDRIKRDFRDVETPTPPLLYSLLVHGRSPSVVNRRADLRTVSVPPNG
jgi:hypothetical protein